MSLCPNTSSPEWRKLVSDLGSEADAHTAFTLNNSEIPTFEQALSLLGGLKVEEKDEQLSRSSDAFKLKRAVDQRTFLETMRFKANPAQKATIEKFIEMNEAYQQFLKQNIENAKQGKPTESTLSVSNFIGSSDFKVDPKEYEAFKLFGTFMHELLEVAQVRALETNKRISEVYTKEFFDEVYANYISKSPFYVENLSEEEMFLSAKELVTSVDEYNKRKFVILPEITVTGTSRSGTKVIGRLDLILIDSSGKVSIFDFKTKKVSSLMQKNDFGYNINVDMAIADLAQKAFPISDKSGTVPDNFINQGMRTAYDTWMLQLDVYENMLRQNGIDVGNKTIASYMYQVDKDKKFMGSAIHIFDNQDYYAQAYNTGLTEDGYWTLEPNVINDTIKTLKKSVMIEVPVSGQEVIEDDVAMKAPEELFDFIPTEENSKKLVDTLNSILEGKIQEIYDQIKTESSKEDKNEDLIKLLKARRDSLVTLSNIVVKNKGKNSTDLLRSVNFFTALDTVEADIKALNEASGKAVVAFRDKKQEGKKTNKEFTELQEAYKKNLSYAAVINTLKQIVDDAAKSNPVLNSPEAPVRMKLSQLEFYSSAIDSNAREAFGEAVKIVLRSPGEVVYERVSDQLRQAYEIEIEKLRADLEKLKSGKGLSVLKSLRYSLVSLMSKEAKDKLVQQASNPEDAAVIDTILKTEKRILQLEEMLNGYKFDEKWFDDYINAITDRGSMHYIGSQKAFNNDAWLQGWMFDQAIATASNSDLFLSAYTTYYKNAMADANYNAFNNPKLIEFDKKRKALLAAGFSIDQLNDLMSEWRSVSYIDKDGVKQTKRVLFAAKPYSEEYEQTYRNFSSELKQVNKEYFELQAKTNEAFGTPEYETFKSELLAKAAERSEFKKKHVEWLLENVSLPYVDDFYKLQNALPAEMASELQEIELEIEAILYNVDGPTNDILLEEHDFDALQELQVKRDKLRQRARKENPAYAQYIDRFNDLYEYDTNDAYFKRLEANAKLQFADDPVRLEKWYQEKTVSRPTEEWYSKLTELSEARAKYYEADPRIKDLLSEKSELLRPYKTGGRINPKYLTDEDIAEVERIDSEIDQIIEENRNSPNKVKLSFDEQNEINKINRELNSLKTKQLSPRYTQEFDERTRNLYSAYARMTEADNRLAEARTKGDKELIADAEERLQTSAKSFKNLEDEYKVWYEKNHTTKYVSITTGYNIRSFKKVRSFNFETLPHPNVAEQYMETVPNPKYFKIRRLRKENWILNGQRLSSLQIEEMKADPMNVNQLIEEGKLEIRQGAYNTGQVKGRDGVPMPKDFEVNLDGHFIVKPGRELSKNVSQKYRKLMNDPQLFSFYNSLMDLFFELQKKTEGRTVGYMIPGYANSAIQGLSNSSMQDFVKKQIQIARDKYVNGVFSKEESEQDAASNMFGEVGQKIRLNHSNQLSEELQSTDAIGSILRYTLEQNINVSLQEVAPIADSAVEFLKMMRAQLQSEAADKETQKRIDELTNLIEIAEFEKRKFQFGQADIETNKKVKKFINNLFAYTSFVRIGFDVANQIKNYTAGNIQAFIAAGGTDSDHYTKTNWLTAKRMVYGNQGFLWNYFKDWGTLTDLSVSTMMYRFYNPLQKDADKYFQEVAGGKTRKLKQKALSPGEAGFFLQDKGDTEIGVTVMYAVMDHYKYKVIKSIDPQTGEKTYETDAEGNTVTVPVHQIYIKGVNGELTRRKDVDFSDADEKMIRNIIYSEIRRAQGNYAKADQTKFEEKIFGRMVFFFRKFLIPQLLNRFGYIRPNWEGAEVAAGYWRMLFRANKYFGTGATLREFVLGDKFLKRLNMTGTRKMVLRDEVTNEVVKEVDAGDLYVRKIAQARRDVIAMLILTILAQMVKAMVKQKDEDDEELGMLEGNAYRILWMTKMETTSMFPVGGGSKEYVRNFTQGIPFVREFESGLKLINHGYSYAMAMAMNGGVEPDPDYDSFYYQEVWKDAFYSRKSGAYEKGDAKIVKDLVDMTGIKNFRDLLDPNYRIDQLKRNQ